MEKEFYFVFLLNIKPFWAKVRLHTNKKNSKYNIFHLKKSSQNYLKFIFRSLFNNFKAFVESFKLRKKLQIPNHTYHSCQNIK
jgi:hypothetical protein